MTDNEQQKKKYHVPNPLLFGRSGTPPRTQGYTSKLMGMGTPTAASAAAAAAVSLERGGSRLSVGSLD
jgi:hypothetical protein